MIGIGVCVDGHCEPPDIDASAPEIWHDHFRRRARKPCIEKDEVVAREQILVQVPVGDAGRDLMYAGEDFHSDRLCGAPNGHHRALPVWIRLVLCYAIDDEGFVNTVVNHYSAVGLLIP